MMEWHDLLTNRVVYVFDDRSRSPTLSMIDILYRTNHINAGSRHDGDEIIAANVNKCMAGMQLKLAKAGVQSELGHVYRNHK